ncbi:nuclear transport factor 2 family protein [Nonomuraea sp. B5E05]|uniref:nuclear transport factor 2 family protein n=1 Tax=Nonomuraea sp. B5E05 TaxID=3153569 RepID=UPI003260E4B5
MPTPDTLPKAILERAQRLFLAKDLNGFADMFAADGTHELPFAPPGVPKFLRGREEIRRYLTSITSTPLELTGFHGLYVHETGDPEVVVAEYEGHGRVVSSGKPYRMPYIQVLRARDGEIVTWRDYWSPLSGIQALGVRGLVPTIVRTAAARWRRGPAAA